jgi:hypothetical protein
MVTQASLGRFGPQSLAEVATWPDAVAKQLFACAPEKAESMKSLLRNGFVMQTDFSGKMGPELVMKMMQIAWTEHGLLSDDYDASRPFCRFASGCDCSVLSQQIMVSSTGGPEHVFPELLSKMPWEHRVEIERRRPSPRSTREEQLQAYVSMEEYLQKNMQGCFPAEFHVPCLRHSGRKCPVSPAAGLGSKEAPPGTGRPLTFAAAGTMCTPWSSAGPRRGLADVATEPWHLWSCEMEARQPDIILLENSNYFPHEIWQKRMGRTHVLVPIRFGPEDHGTFVASRLLLFQVGDSSRATGP